MKRTIALILSIVLVLSLSAAMFSVAADYIPSPEHPDASESETEVITEPQGGDDDVQTPGSDSTVIIVVVCVVVVAAAGIIIFVVLKKKKNESDKK